MMKNFHFVINEEREEFELWVNGECITDCFSLKSEAADLLEQLVEFANVPCYERLNAEMVRKKVVEY